MSQDSFAKLCDTNVLKIAANYVHDDKKDDFIPDIFGNQDYIFDLQENLCRLSRSLKNGTYRPRLLKEIDVPKSGMAVRPGSVLDIEDHIVLFGVAYLLAPVLDRALPANVFHFRVKKSQGRPHPERLFDNRGPILIRKDIRQRVRLFENWYEAWPDFITEAQSIYEQEGFTFMVESDITAYFENISHPILADILRQYAPRQLRLINLLLDILTVWTTPSLTGFKPQRGIPQGNDVSSWLGTLYLVQMDIELHKFQRRGLIRYVRYVDDIKIFTKDPKTARSVLFTINRILRCLHLNIQSSKTDIYEGDDVRRHLYDERVEKVSTIIDDLPNRSSRITNEQRKKAEEIVRPLFKKYLAYKPDISKEDLRLFKRILTVLTRVRSPIAIKQCLKWLWKQPGVTLKIAKYLNHWMGRKVVRNEIEKLLFGGEELFDHQYLILLSVLRNSKVFRLEHKEHLLRLGCGGAHHWAVRAEALLSLILFPLSNADFRKLKRHYRKEVSPTVKKAILAIFLKAPDRLKRPMFAETIQEPEEETNRYRKYAWALMYSPELGQPALAAMIKYEKDQARLLASLHAALQSRNSATLRQVKSIADKLLKASSSRLASQAFAKVSNDSKLMIEELKRPRIAGRPAAE